MSVFQSAVLGLIQGLTEFLPVSSSSHLVFLPKLFGWADHGLAFDAVIHLGTLVAVVAYFRKRLSKIIIAIYKDRRSSITDNLFNDQGSVISDQRSKIKEQETSENRWLGWLILLATVPAAVIGLFFGDWIEANARSAGIIAFGMIFWGVMLGVADFINYKSKIINHKSLMNLNLKQVLFIGCAQAIALIPGTSRSGITMTAGLFSKLDRKSAAEFSFLISAPIIALAGASKLIDLIQHGSSDIGWLPLLIGLAASAISGFAAIWGLMKIIQRWSFMPFVIYRVVVGIIILFWLV